MFKRGKKKTEKKSELKDPVTFPKDLEKLKKSIKWEKVTDKTFEGTLAEVLDGFLAHPKLVEKSVDLHPEATNFETEEKWAEEATKDGVKYRKLKTTYLQKVNETFLGKSFSDATVTRDFWVVESADKSVVAMWIRSIATGPPFVDLQNTHEIWFFRKTGDNEFQFQTQAGMEKVKSTMVPFVMEKIKSSSIGANKVWLPMVTKWLPGVLERWRESKKADEKKERKPSDSTASDIAAPAGSAEDAEPSTEADENSITASKTADVPAVADAVGAE